MALVLPASSNVFVDLPAKSAFIKGLHGCRDWPVSSDVILNVLVFFKVDSGRNSRLKKLFRGLLDSYVVTIGKANISSFT